MTGSPRYAVNISGAPVRCRKVGFKCLATNTAPCDQMLEPTLSTRCAQNDSVQGMACVHDLKFVLHVLVVAHTTAKSTEIFRVQTQA